MEIKEGMYSRPLNVTYYVLESKVNSFYRTKEVDNTEELEAIYKEVLGYLAKLNDIDVEDIPKSHDVELEEQYTSREHTDYVTITEDTYYLYEAMTRLADGECDRVQIWEYPTEKQVEVGEDGKEIEVTVRNLLMSIEAVASPMGLKEFANSNASPKINISTVAKAPEKTLSFSDLKKVAEQKRLAEEAEANKLLSEFEDVNELLDTSPPELEMEESEEETLYSFEEVKVLVDKAFKEGYQKAVEELG